MNRFQSYFLQGGLLISLISCQKDKPIRPEWFTQGWGEVSALLNGKQWTNTGATSLRVKGQLNSTCNGYLTLHFHKFSNDGYARQLLQIDGVPAQAKGRYAVVDLLSSRCGTGSVLAGYFTSQDDGDVGKSTYSLDNILSSHLEITAYDSASHRITGRFEMAFIKQAKYQNDDPPTVQFESGQFTTPVSDKGRFE
jgi:hypothetical protein